MKRASVPDDLSVQLELVEKTDDLRNNARRNIVNFFSPIVQTVIEKNASILTPVQKEEEYAEKLALEIEHHLYLELWNQHSQPTSQYKLKARGIGLNLPKNPLLQSRLLKGEVTPERLVQMKPEEMASKEFQLLAEQVRRESELQNTIVAEETGPRIRRTHKGEEIVGDDIDHSNGSDEPVYSASRGTTDHVMEDPPSAQRSRAGTPSIEDSHMSPPQTAQAYNEDASHSGSAPQTPRTPVSAKTPINSGRQFSMENVWSNINTPENDHIQRPASRPPPPQLLSIRQQPKLAIDADIDKLLAEEDHDMENETPPYSPSELTFSDTVVPVWRGRFSMVLVANFSARANYLGGPQNAHHTLPLNDLLASIVQVDGRIAIDRATEYLCGQKFSSTNEIVVLSIEPEDNLESTALGEFNKLFNYFQRKERYGVIGKPPHKAVKDCYVVPIDTRDDMPDFFETLPNHLLEQSPRKKRVFAVVFVLSKIALAEERSLREGTTGTGKSALSSPRVTPGTALSPHAHMSLQQQNIQPVFAAATQQYHHPSASPQQPLPPLPPPPHNQNHQGYPPQQQQQQFSGGYAGNGYGYYPQQQQQQQQPPHPPPQQQPPVKKFTFTPWKELEEVLPHLTLEQVNRINQAVAINPAAQTDPSLLAQLIKDQ
ncbi:transcription factor S-II, central domain-containing protein [Peziza echinospora]|nr:transcription factor S-II, central domain-containing protein [Peziza echinospora]